MNIEPGGWADAIITAVSFLVVCIISFRMGYDSGQTKGMKRAIELVEEAIKIIEGST